MLDCKATIKQRRRWLMATESIGKTIYLTDEQAEQLIEEMARVDANPPKPSNHILEFADPNEVLDALKRKFNK
jgi:hypothetical protein